MLYHYPLPPPPSRLCLPFTPPPVSQIKLLTFPHPLHRHHEKLYFLFLSNVYAPLHFFLDSMNWIHAPT